MHKLTLPALHKLSEGLFLSGWTYWEALCRELLVTDLATDIRGKLRRDVVSFRTPKAPLRLAERMLNHPDHPERFADWSDYGLVRRRADEFLGAGHRFIALSRANDLSHLKRIRNAIAHRSDKAWHSFRSLVQLPPFSLAPKQLRGLTPGGLLFNHRWNGKAALLEAAHIFADCAKELVP